MAEASPVVGQKLRFDNGVLEVVTSFTSQNGQLHKTVDGGFFFGPGMPLKDQEIADSLPEPYKTEATAFIAALPPEVPPEEIPPPEADSESGGGLHRRGRR